MNANQAALAELNTLVILLYQQRRYQEALHIAHQSVLLTKDSGGSNYPEFVTTLKYLALLYDALGMNQKAAQLSRQLQQTQENVAGKKDLISEKFPPMKMSDDLMEMFEQAELICSQIEQSMRQPRPTEKRFPVEQKPGYPKSISPVEIPGGSLPVYEEIKPVSTPVLQDEKEIPVEQAPGYLKSTSPVEIPSGSLPVYEEIKPVSTQVLQEEKEIPVEQEPGYPESISPVEIPGSSLPVYEEIKPVSTQVSLDEKEIPVEQEPGYPESISPVEIPGGSLTAYEEINPVSTQVLQEEKEIPVEQEPGYPESISPVGIPGGSLTAYKEINPVSTQMSLDEKEIPVEQEPGSTYYRNQMVMPEDTMPLSEQAEPSSYIPKDSYLPRKKPKKRLSGARPFLKWAAGKTKLLGELEKRLPEEIQTGKITKYAAPFIGSGAFFFSLNQKYSFEHCMICDVNEELILTYKVIKKGVHQLIENLTILESEYRSKDDENRKLLYYQIRDEFNRKLPVSHSGRFSSKWTKLAAQIIFLNHTGKTGMFRVNRQGKFNVPFGNYKNPEICNADNLKSVSGLLEKTRIVSGDFTKLRTFVNDTTFVYFDPLYNPLNQTSSFTSYSKNGSYGEDQDRLVRFFNELDKKGAKIMLSNSDPKNQNPDDTFFDDHFSDYTIERVPATYTINSNGNRRGKLYELIITNYR